MTLIAILPPLLAALAGLAVGLAHFAVLRLTADALAGGFLLPAALTLARLMAVTAGFATVASLGAGPLLAAFVGFLLARRLAVDPVRRRLAR